MVGVHTAAPILFDVFDKLPKSEWFTAPFNEMVDVEVCAKSGYRATDICEEKTSMSISVTGLRSEPCPYHKIVHLDEDEQYLVNTSCESPDDIVQRSWFVLPPVIEHYYQEKHPFYKKLPEFKSTCVNTREESIAFIYPKEQTKIYLPKGLNGEKNDVILKVAHSDGEATLFWYLDDTYLGKTQKFHELSIQPKAGKYTLTVIDESGRELSKRIEIKA